MPNEKPDDQHLFERVALLLQQQKEMYGGFEIPKPGKNTTEEHKTSPVGAYRHAPQHNTPKHETNRHTPQHNTPQHHTPEHEKIAACNTLDQLKALCAESDALKTDLPNTNLVFGVGNPTADLMIVGEAPGETEDRLMKPFVGKAGQLLDKIIAAIHFDRTQVYIANILKHRPPRNRDPLPEERERSLPYLLRQIELVDPKLILCVGRVSATTLLGKDLSLKQMRQKYHAFHGRELMVTYHPAALLRNPQWKRPTWEDVQKLRARYDELGGA